MNKDNLSEQAHERIKLIYGQLDYLDFLSDTGKITNQEKWDIVAESVKEFENWKKENGI